ncbi:hypothetical protein Tco_1068289 [Tanacetum coccineum]|uniref:Uncharacterized protein n=1 Tax=Tanacetum coccineum TaxID=301880 RepID=A0ABQ5HH74_9ASTR
MVVLESFPKHNLVAYLEKTDGNTEFHEIISFLLREAPFTFLIVVCKPVSISKASIRSDLLFDDADGIDSLPNQAIFDAIRLMGAFSTTLETLKGKHFSGNATPLFDSMLVQPTEDEDQHETQTDPSPRPSPTTHIPDSIPEGSGGNHGDQAKEIKHLKAQIKKLKKKAKPVITHHKAWIKRRKSDKAKPTVHKDPTFDELDDDKIDYMETEDAQDVGRTKYVVHEEKESAEKEVSTKDALSTAQPKVSTDKPEVSTERPDEDTDKQKVSTDKEEVSTDRPDEGTVDQNEGRSATQTTPTTTTPTIFGDDKTIAQVLIIMSQNKEKLKEKEKKEYSLRMLMKGITEDEKKFKQLARDEEVVRKVQEDWEAEEEILAEKLQEEEREMYTIEQRAKLLHDTIAGQKRFLAQQRYEAIRNKPPLRNQLRNQMMTYLKHVGGKKHSDLKAKTFEEIQVLYERLKRHDLNFVAIRSAEDERQIKEWNKDPEKKKLKKRVVNEEDTAKVPAEQEVTKQGTKKRKSGHVKMIARKRLRPQPDNDSDDEYRKCLRIITFESTIDSEIMETKLFISRVHKVSSPDGNYHVLTELMVALQWLFNDLIGCLLQNLQVNNSLVVYNEELTIPEQMATDKLLMKMDSLKKSKKDDNGLPKVATVSNSYHLRHSLRGGISKEVGTPRYLILVVPLIKAGNEAVHKELGDRMEMRLPLLLLA